MKIAVNSRMYEKYQTGISNYIKNLYENLIELDKENDYLFLQTTNKRSLGKTKIKTIGNRDIQGSFFDLFSINSLFSYEDIDIFHGPSHILPFFKQKKIKYVLTIHDIAFIKNPSLYPAIFRFYYDIFLKRSINNADIILTVSENTRRDVLTEYNIDPEKIKTIHLGINKIFFKTSKKNRLIKEKYFLSITTHPKRKNIFSILEVIAKNKEFKDIKYVIAGIIPRFQLEEIKIKLRELNIEDNVRIFGYASEKDLLNLYKNAEFFIYPSFYEGFGFPVLEAMACKCPVITSNNSSLIEITPNNEWLIDPYDLEDISKKMYKMINLSKKERVRLVNNNYIFSKKFTWERTAKSYLNVFESLK